MPTYRIETQILPSRRGQVYRAVRDEGGERVLLRTFALGQAEHRPAPAHAGAARLLETGRFRDRAYVVSEFLPGPTLEVAGGDAARLLPPLLRTVGAAHAEGIVHGHLRPHNVHLVEGRGPVVADYGVPWFPGEESAYVRIAAWLPPEQRVDLRRAQVASDLWGLGAIACYLLSGEPPGEGADPAPELEGPEGLVAVVRALLRPEPARRMSCRQALEALGEETPALAAR